MEWRVKLSGDYSDLNNLSKSLSSEELKIIRSENDFVLCSSELNNLEDSYRILEKSNEILAYLNAGSNIIKELSKPLEISCIESINEDGSITTYISIQAAVTVIGSVEPTVLINGQLQENNYYGNLQKWITLALQNKNIADVFAYLNSGSNDMAALYKVYEIIEKDAGGEKVVRDNGWASRNEIERFTRTANSPDSIGKEARHGVQQSDPPKNPIALKEAKSLIEHITKCWMESKS